MDFVLCCTDCGHHIKTMEDGSEEEIICEKCGATMDISAKNETMAIRMKAYASLIMPRRTRTLKVFCPVCGKRQCRSAAGTYTETVCGKCQTEFAYEVEPDKLYIELLHSSEKQPTTKNKNPERAVRASNPA